MWEGGNVEHLEIIENAWVLVSEIRWYIMLKSKIMVLNVVLELIAHDEHLIPGGAVSDNDIASMENYELAGFIVSVVWDEYFNAFHIAAHLDLTLL